MTLMVERTDSQLGSTNCDAAKPLMQPMLYFCQQAGSSITREGMAANGHDRNERQEHGQTREEDQNRAALGKEKQQDVKEACLTGP